MVLIDFLDNTDKDPALVALVKAYRRDTDRTIVSYASRSECTVKKFDLVTNQMRLGTRLVLMRSESPDNGSPYTLFFQAELPQERTTDRQVARHPWFQDLIYAFPKNDREWKINDLLDRFLLEPGCSRQAHQSQVALRDLVKLLSLTIANREEQYDVALERLEEGNSYPLQLEPLYELQIKEQNQ